MLGDDVDGFAGVFGDERVQLAAVGVEDASVGLVSRTYAQKGATANRTLGDSLDDIVAGLWRNA